MNWTSDSTQLDVTRRRFTRDVWLFRAVWWLGGGLLFAYSVMAYQRLSIVVVSGVVGLLGFGVRQRLAVRRMARGGPLVGVVYTNRWGESSPWRKPALVSTIEVEGGVVRVSPMNVIAQHPLDLELSAVSAVVCARRYRFTEVLLTPVEGYAGLSYDQAQTASALPLYARLSGDVCDRVHALMGE